MKRFGILLFSFFGIYGGVVLKAQPVNFNLPQSNIVDRQEYTQSITSGTLVKKSGGWRASNGEWYVNLRSNVSLTFPINQISIRLENIDGVTPGTSGLDGVWPDYKTLTTSYQSFFQPSSRYAATPAGNILMSYNMPTSGMSTNAFVAGTYSTTIQTNQATSSTRHYISPSSWTMNIIVPSFTAWYNSTATFGHTFSDASSFSSPQDLVFDLSNFVISHTVGSYIDVKAQGPINFAPHGGGASSTLPVSMVQVYGTGYTTRSMSTTYQNLNSTAYAVPAGNRTTTPVLVKIAATDIASNFFNAGTYTFTLDLKTRDSGGTVSDTKSITFTITTNPFYNISVQGSSDVSFTYASATDYQIDQSQDIPNHLLITNNKPFEVYVKSGAAYFTLNGTPTTVPSSIVQVENGTGETAIITRSITTTPQAILSAAPAVLNRNVSIKYTIPTSQASNLVGQSTGATPYILPVVFSFTNL